VPNYSGLAVFKPIADGSLTQVTGPLGGCITADGSSSDPNECQSLGSTGPVLYSTFAVTISPSGKHVFVAGANGSTVFSRNPSTGALSIADCVEGVAGTIPFCQSVDGANGMGVEVSPDGTRAIVGGEDVAGFGVYNFDETTGHLSQLPGTEGCYSGSGATGCTPVPGGRYGKSVWAPDGLNAYVMPDGSLINVRQDHPPVCTSRTITVKANTSKPVPLSCIDANGDIITSIQAGSASKGQLGPVINGSVVYTPPKNFTGTATFSVTATADGRTGAPATITVKVPDTLVVLKIGTKTLKLDAQGRAKVKVSCSALEEHGPCAGTITVKTRGMVPSGGGTKVVTLAGARYRIKAGATKAVVVQLSPTNVTLVRRVADARKLRLVAKVKDAKGNTATVTKKATLTLP
jgi:hypothetical protein